MKGPEALDRTPDLYRPQRGAVAQPGAEGVHDVGCPPTPTFSLAGQQVKSDFGGRKEGRKKPRSRWAAICLDRVASPCGPEGRLS